LSEPDKAEQKKMAIEYFTPKIEQLKKYATIAENRFQTINESERGYFMNAKWSWSFASIVYDNLVDIWEMLKEIVDEFIESKTDTSTMKTRMENLSKELEKRRPALREIDRMMKASREEMRQNR
jgi:hypothetical protein